MKKETDTKAASISKLKFRPKAPGPKKKNDLPKKEPTIVKQEPSDVDDILRQRILEANASFGGRRMPKTEEKVKAKAEQVSFGATTFGASGSFSSRNSVSSFKVEKEEDPYVFPWDESSNYPITLPLREDKSDPKILNEEEFGGSIASSLAFGTELDPASKLGLNIKSENPQMMFFQLPRVLPLFKPDMEASSSRGANKGCKLRDVSGGYMGKLLVYKSGKVKMKFGDNFFDVYPGSECKFSQDVAVVNLKEKHCCVIGQLGKERAIVIPDVGSMLDSMDLKTN